MILLDPARDTNCSSCSYCSWIGSRIGDLNTSKAKLREAKYQRENKDRAVLLAVLQRCKVVINGLYSTHEREIHDRSGIVRAVRQTNSN